MITAREAFKRSTEVCADTFDYNKKIADCVLQFLEILIEEQIRQGLFRLTLIFDPQTFTQERGEFEKINPQLQGKFWKAQGKQWHWSDLEEELFSNVSVQKIVFEMLEICDFSVDFISSRVVFGVKTLKISWENVEEK